MRKKLLTVALAATMAVASVFSAFAETLTGTAWWNGMSPSSEAELSGDGTVTFEVSVTSGDDAGNVALSAEMFTTDPKYYFTIGSDGNAWFAETANVDVKVDCPFVEGSENNPKLTVGHKYEVSINRTGKVFKANYYDVTDGKELCRMTGTTSVDSPATMKIHLMVQLGTMDINVKSGAAILDPAADSSNDRKEDNTTAAPSNDKKEDATTAAPAGNKDNVTPSKTGDTSVVAVVAIVALGAAVAVVASKKKVTE